MVKFFYVVVLQKGDEGIQDESVQDFLRVLVDFPAPGGVDEEVGAVHGVVGAQDAVQGFAFFPVEIAGEEFFLVCSGESLRLAEIGCFGAPLGGYHFAAQKIPDVVGFSLFSVSCYDTAFLSHAASLMTHRFNTRVCFGPMGLAPLSKSKT